MEQRIVNLKIKNEYIIGSGVSIGSVGSHDDVLLEMDFRSSAAWAGTTKRAIFSNALGDNRTPIILTTNLLAEGHTEVYLVPVPAEAKDVAGECFLTVEGFVTDGAKEILRIVTEEATFRVLPSKLYSNDNPSITPSQAEQLQSEIDEIKNTIVDVTDSKEYSAEKAELAGTHALTSESWAVGQKNGKDVEKTDPTYQNNAKYWSQLSMAEEPKRQENENVRISNENVRITNEEGRVTAETARDAAEQAREEAEEQRAAAYPSVIKTVTEARNNAVNAAASAQAAKAALEQSIVKNPGSTVIDPTLSIAGAAAEAAAVGQLKDDLADLESRTSEFSEVIGASVIKKCSAVSDMTWGHTIVIDGINMRKGVQYRFKVTCTETISSSFYLYLLKVDSTEILFKQLSGLNVYEFVYTPTSDIENAKITVSGGTNKKYTVEASFGSTESYFTSVEQETNDNSIKLYGVGKPVVPSFDLTENKYINFTWGVIGENTGDWISSPIRMNKNDTIVVDVFGEGDAVSIITKCDSDGSNMIPLVKSIDSAKRTYTYTATSDIYVIVGGRTKEYTVNLFGSNTIKHLLDSVSSLKEEIDSIKMERNDENEICGMMRIFHNIGIVGDSLSSGEIVGGTPGSYTFNDRYEFSWLSNICRKNGLNAIHFSRGGRTAKNWIQYKDSSDLPNKWTESEPCNAYYLALGTNDSEQSDYPLGSVSDSIGMDSFVGYYKQIISMIHEKAPNAVILCVTTYDNNNQTKKAFNNMINAISDLYDYCFFVDFAGNSEHTLNNTAYKYGGHYDTIGYMKVSDDVEKLTNRIIFENSDYFAKYGILN